MSNAAPDASDQPESAQTAALSIEQYKGKLGDLASLGSRQMSMTAYYVSIISALFGVLAFKEKSLYDVDLAVLAMLCFAGILVCVLWYFSLSYFRGIFRVKFQVLEEIEMTLPHRTFRREKELINTSRLGTWTWIERLLPLVFVLLFLSVVAVRLARL
jgi:hypothetical protein